MPTDNRDQNVTGPHAFFDGFYKVDPEVDVIDIEEDLVLGKAR